MTDNRNRKKRSGRLLTGTMQKHRKGFGFVITDDENDELGDIFISGDSMNGEIGRASCRERV